MSLYLRLGAYLAAVLACIAIGWHMGSLGPKRDLAALQAQDWQAKYSDSQAALTAVQGQLKQAQTVSANNSAVIQGLQSDNAKIAADRAADLQLARRLLNSANPATTGSGVVSKATSGQPTPGAGQPAGPSVLESLLADAAAESEHCAAQLNSLIAEIRPQL